MFNKRKKEKNKKRYLELVNKSIGAAFLISLGNYALLKLGNPIGPVIFAFGLLGVCYMGQNLFTGKCGFLIQDKIKPSDLLIILVVNLVAGYLFGLLYSCLDTEVVANAVSKVGTWEVTFPFLVKSILCGMIMYIAVYMYKKGTPLEGAIFEVYNSNVITLGVAKTFHLSLLLCVIGNFVGSMFMWFISKDM